MGRTLRELQSGQTQIGTYLQAANEVQTQLDQLVASRTLATLMPNNQKQLLQVSAEIDRVQTQYRTISDLLAKATGRLTFDSAVELFTDLRGRQEQAQNYFQNWRRMKAVFDLNVALGNFSKEGEPGVTRDQAEEQLAQAEVEYNAALTLADEIMPVVASAKSSLLITG